ncbi:hypothetical protein BLA60_04665 [Actinophytocola xinjiangensis]|uniref:Gas vesicle protein GvpL/GvpF n=1 Tax=Actinophytocola xinjiangensis TaxID=485602 RepID=A0A7Z0WSA8_9PSEU|nr:GvpL/GvpF family gas vesicle protein [Actinophytocola xinjiangensis]OLF14416.1 hypothetical protein BLA60_04665 [Actinophytocola xinjiangensis]
MTEYGSWVYAVAREVDAHLLDGLTGVAGETVRSVAGKGLSAVVGTVPLAEFGEQALRRNLEDLDWLAGVARAHDAVVAAVALTVPAVPFRLTTVYYDDDRVAELLRTDASRFTETLDRIAGRTEWGVRALLDRDRLREPQPAAPATGSAGAGAAYLRRRRTERDTGARIEQFAREQADTLHAALAAHAVDARRNRPHAPALADPNRPMILNGAYLVAERDAAAFAETVHELDRRTEEVELRLTGPWPAYSFATTGGEP